MNKLKKIKQPTDQELKSSKEQPEEITDDNTKDSKLSKRKVTLVPISKDFLEYVINTESDQGGEMLVALKKALFGEQSTEKWLDTFKRIQSALDEFDIGERLKLAYYIDAPDFLMYFKMTDHADDWIKGLRDKEAMQLISLLATEFGYFNKGTPESTLKEFSRFKGKSDTDIEKFFSRYHQSNESDENENEDNKKSEDVEE